MRWLGLLVALVGCDRILNLQTVTSVDAEIPLPPGDWLMSASGAVHTCALRMDGSLWCWGGNQQGELGVGSAITERTDPTRVGSAKWKTISASLSSTCGIQTDGTLWCWGTHYVDNTNYVSVFDPTMVPGAFTQVSVGAYHVCALKPDHTAWCWGLNYNGELGTNDVVPRVSPTQITSGPQWLSVSAGGFHSCGLATDGTAWCWGQNNVGELGIGNNSIPEVHVPAQVDAEQWMAVTTGNAHTCGILASGHLRCWGSNSNGQLGDDLPTSTVNSSFSPVAVGPDDTTWSAVGAGVTDTCAIDAAGRLLCWGANTNGELGNSIPSPSQPSPVVVTGGARTWSAVGLGAISTCAIGTDHNMWCFGVTRLGASGSVLVPTRVPGTTGWKAVATGAQATCAIDDAGALSCWGANATGQLGDNTFLQRTSPTKIADPTWTQVALGPQGACATNADGSVWCWGSMATGLGDGSTIRLMPTLISTGGWTSVGMGSTAICGIENSSLYCWGDNNNGELAVGNFTTYMTPQPSPSGMGTWTSISAGHSYACGIAGVNVMCWGSNNVGQVGDGSLMAQSLPVPTMKGTAVSAAANHACAISAGTASCWGFNLNGQLGNGSTSESDVPVALPGVWAELAAGDQHTCGVQTDGTLWCWGGDSTGQLGDGAHAMQPAPVPVGRDTDWKHVAAGLDHTCAIKTDRSLWCWGNNASGQIGLGTSAFGLLVLVPPL